MKYLTCILFLIFAFTSQATTYNAANGSFQVVQSNVNLCADGDSVVLPVGTNTWNTSLTNSHYLTLQGSTNGITKLIAGTSGKELIDLTATSTNGLARLCYLVLDGNQQAECVNVFRTTNVYSHFRIDHCTLTQANNFYAVHVCQLVAGVVDHCSFVDNYLNTGCQFNVYDDWDLSWQLPLTLGTVNTVVYEDDSFVHTASGYHPFDGSFENGYGGRICLRYCTWTNFSSSADQPIFDAHGNQNFVNTNTDVGIDGLGNVGLGSRATRQIEIYNNNFDAPSGGTGGNPVYYRGGTFVYYNNLYTNNAGGDAFSTSVEFDEEDTCRFGSGYSYTGWVITNYPGMDMQWFWGWSNYDQGTLISAWHGGLCGTTNNVCLTTNNVQWIPPSTAHPGYPEQFLKNGIGGVQYSTPVTNYIPLVYPHPFIGAPGTNPPATSITGLFITQSSTNLLKNSWVDLLTNDYRSNSNVMAFIRANPMALFRLKIK